VRAVECNGFTPAARDLGVTPSAGSKLVTRLERRLGVRLLQRSTRRLALTAEGEISFERLQRIVGDIEDAESDVMRFGGAPRGRVRMSMGTAFATYALVPALPEFTARFPEITLDLVITEYAVDLIEAGIDVAIRIGPPGDVNLAARRIGELERVISAAPAQAAAWCRSCSTRTGPSRCRCTPCTCPRAARPRSTRSSGSWSRNSRRCRGGSRTPSNRSWVEAGRAILVAGDEPGGKRLAARIARSGAPVSVRRGPRGQ
jgi:DNA-binding transcriptional LysR family regulator